MLCRFSKRLFGALWRGLDRVAQGPAPGCSAWCCFRAHSELVADADLVPRSAALVHRSARRAGRAALGRSARARAREGSGIPLDETLTQDLIEAIRTAKDDDRIKALVLQLGGLGGAGLEQAAGYRAARFHRFKDTGKQVVADRATAYTRNQYYLGRTSRRDLHEPDGHRVDRRLIAGFCRTSSRRSTSFRSIFTSGRSGSTSRSSSRSRATECPTKTGRRARLSGRALGCLSARCRGGTRAAARGLQRYADDAVTLLADADGDAGVLAANYGLVDQLLTRDQERERIKELVGADASRTTISHRSATKPICAVCAASH